MADVILKNVSMVYLNLLGRKPKVAVDNVSFSVSKGCIYGLLGPNGAGKTTIIKMLCGLVLPTSGSLQVHGSDIIKDKYKALKNVGAVLEGSRNIHWRFTPMENLLYFADLKNIERKIAKKRALRLLEELDLAGKTAKNTIVGKLSRGMQQKVAIAVALITDPPILFLDEPTIGLDVKTSRHIKQYLKKIAGKRQKTIVITTHQMQLAREICDIFGFLNNGRLIKEGTFRELQNYVRSFSESNSDFEEIFLKIIENDSKEDSQ